MSIIEYLERFRWVLENNPEIMEDIIREQGRHTRETPTLGGKVLWRTVQVGPWRIQKNTLFGNCRVLDGKDQMVADGTEAEFMGLFSEKFREHQQKSSLDKREWGIVFSGGGGKGAYEIGVWRYLHEQGMESKITGIAGTSVGALNGLLFLQGDYDRAATVWSNVQQKDMLTMDALHIIDMVISTPLAKAFAAGLGMEPPQKLAEKIVEDLWHYQKTEQKGIYRQDGIEKLLRENINWARVRKNFEEKRLYCTVATPEPIESFAKYCLLNGRNKEDIINTVLQSAALPMAYGARPEANGRHSYLDGGLADNVPILPLLKDGYRKIIVIHLAGKNQENENKWRKPLQGRSLAEVMLYHVWPAKDFWEGFGDTWAGNFRAMLAVNPELSRKRMEQGYADARIQLAGITQ